MLSITKKIAYSVRIMSQPTTPEEEQPTLRDEIADITGFLSSIPEALENENVDLDSLQEIVEDLDGTIKDLRQMLKEFKKKAKPKEAKSDS